MNKELLDKAAQASGLSVAVVRALLEAGYSYNETMYGPVTWIRDSLPTHHI